MGAVVAEFVIDLEPVTKKNSQQIVMAGGRPRLIQSQKYKAYETACGWLIPANARKLKINYPVNIKAVYYRATRRRVDLTNLNSALHDVLTAHGVLADDNYTIAAGTDGSRVRFDKDRPRTEVTITRLEDSDG